MKKILFLQLPGTPISPEENRENIPFAAGCLAAYLKDKGLHKQYRLLIPNHKMINDLGDDGLIKHITQIKPDIISYTLYMWNSERSVYIASKVKEVLTKCKIIFGGPEISMDNRWVLRCKAVDHFVSGEGEVALYKLLTKQTKKRFIRPGKPPDKFFSPYLSNTLKPEKGGIVYVEAQRGCPFSCTFCYYPHSGEAIRQLAPREIELILQRATKSGARDIIFIDPTFNNYRPFNKLLDLLIKTNKNRKFAYHAEIKPHLLTDEEIKKINRAGFGTLEVGLQTINKKTQEKIRCLIPIQKFTENTNKLNKKISVRLDLLCGLPGETENDIKKSINYVVKNHRHCDLYFYNLSVIPSTAMREKFKPGAYQEKPPYFVLNNGRIGPREIRKLNSYFQKTTGEEFDPLPRLHEARPFPVVTASLYNFVEFRIEKITEGFKTRVAETVTDLTSTNPYSALVVLIKSPASKKKELTKIIFDHSRLVLDQYVNRMRIYSAENIANLRVYYQD